jgi:hypothetical protein
VTRMHTAIATVLSCLVCERDAEVAMLINYMLYLAGKIT